MTSQHHLHDVRIYQKEIKSLLTRYNKIYWIGKKDEQIEYTQGLSLLCVNNRPGLFYRVVRNFEILVKAIKLNAHVYHFHDPDLIYVGFILKLLFRKKIIYDIHEYFVDIIRHRNYLNKWLGVFLSNLYKYSEKFCLPKFDLLILAEENYFPFYKKYQNVVIVQNYVKKENILNQNVRKVIKSTIDLVYLGGISIQRGIWETIEFLNILNDRFPTNLHIIGPFESLELRNQVIAKVKEYKLTSNFNYYGYIQHEKAIEMIRNFDIGVFLLHPIQNYTTSLPTKLFEFMGNGLSVICSDFPKLVELNKQIGFGLTIDGFSLEKEKSRIFDYLKDENKLRSVRKHNIETVKKKYLWEFEEKKLFDAYDKLLGTMSIKEYSRTI